MKDDNARRLGPTAFLTEDGCDLEAFRALVDRTVNPADYPFAGDVVSNALGLRRRRRPPRRRLARKPPGDDGGVGGGDDRGPRRHRLPQGLHRPRPIEAANAHFWAMIEEQHRSNPARGDHFAKPGANDRVWNALEKLCLADPAAFAAYYGNADHRARQRGVARARLSDHLAAQCRQSGRRGAGSPSRLSHGLPDGARDRALSRACASPVADADAAGRGRPLRHAARIRTDALPAVLAGLSARLSRGAARRIPRLFRGAQGPAAAAAGDAVFFNPALFHAAGTNRSTNIRRIANLLQVSSAYGRAMESVDRLKMSLALYPVAAEAPGGEGDHARKPPTTRSPPRPKATRSRPISTAIPRSAAWRRRASRR